MKCFFGRGQWSWIALLVLGTAAPCAMAGANYSAVILNDLPIAYYRLGDPGTSVTAADSSGNGRDGIYSRGVVNGAAGAIVGDADTAAQFDQKTAWVTVPAVGNDALNMGNGFTFEAWVINNGQGGVPGSPLGRIVSRGWPGRFGYGWGILTNDGMRFTTYGIKDFDSNQTVVPRDGAWHYVAVVFDSGNSANFYLDGALTDIISHTSPTAKADLDFMIGRNPASTAEEFFNGSIDEVAIYGAELTADQILAHYQAGL